MTTEPEPLTAAGKRLLFEVAGILALAPDSPIYVNAEYLTDRILAVEAEARAILRAELAAKVEALREYGYLTRPGGHPDSSNAIVVRAAVRALLSPTEAE